MFLIEEAIAATELPVSVHIAENGERAIQFFDRADRLSNAPCPALVILDINLPKKPGQEVLRHLRESPKCGKARVIVVSTSNSEGDRQRMAGLGADNYFPKPSDYAEFMKLSDLIKGVFKPTR